jgi:hypothetical protein
MLVKALKIAAVVIGGPLFALALLQLGCGCNPPFFGEHCSPHLAMGLLFGLTLAFWIVVPVGVLAIRVMRGAE